MTKPKLNLWLLNRCVEWDHSKMVRALSAKYDVQIGRRHMAHGAPPAAPTTPDLYVNANEEGLPGELMHERNGKPKAGPTTQYDEYFVPIPIKCLGDPRSAFWQAFVSQRTGAREQLDAIIAALHARFGDPLCHDQRAAKQVIGPNFGDVVMNLEDRSLGYYQLLQLATAQTGGKNVLVGYSQGGTVARYLAFLDEQLAPAGQGCVHGVITVQAPNRGSPLASKDQRPAVGAALIAILLSLPRWMPDEPFEASGLWKFLLASQRKDSLVYFVNSLLDWELETWSGDDTKERSLLLWRTMRKWLSGLSGIKDLAFWDLDPERLGDAASVLQAIDRYPLQSVKHGAVIAADNRVVDLIHALIASEPWYFRALEWVERKLIARLVAEASLIYADQLIAVAPRFAQLSSDYVNGVAPGLSGLDSAIPSKAHDFVIPSVSQLLLPGVNPNHLGNHLNRNASHLTGADLTARDNGRSDEDMVVSMLEHM